MQTISVAEARRLLVPVGRLVCLLVPDPDLGSARPDGCRAAILRSAARYDAACRDAGSEGPIPKTGTGRAQHVRRAVHGAAIDRAVMGQVDGRREAARRDRLWPLYRCRL